MTRQEARCAWCKGSEPPLIPVGFVEQGTSAGAYILACSDCRDARDLLPLAEHPDDTDGLPRTRRPSC